MNTITSGTWTVNPDIFTPPFAALTLSGDQFALNGRFALGDVAARSACSAGTACSPGQMLPLDALFSNPTPDPFARFAYGSASVGGAIYPDVEFGGTVRLNGGTVTLPTPGGPDELVSVAAPFALTGTLTGVQGVHDPALAFTLPLLGQGTATLTLRSEPDGSGGVRLVFWGLTYVFGTE